MFSFFITLLSLLGRRLVGDRSPTGRRPVASSRKEVPMRSPISRQPVPDQSPTSGRPTAKPSCDSFAIVMKFGRGEVAERLQCMSDWGFNRANWIQLTTKGQSLDVSIDHDNYQIHQVVYNPGHSSRPFSTVTS